MQYAGRPGRADLYAFGVFMSRLVVIAALAGLCGACASTSTLPTGTQAYQVLADTSAQAELGDYVIGPQDRVSVIVFREPDLSVAEAVVDPSGKLALPLLGMVPAGGKTADALAKQLENDLREYLRNPIVTVSVNSITQKYTVEGSVGQAGVFDMRGRTTLLEAVAMARSPTQVADLDQIFVFRDINGVTHGARFDLRRIRTGVDPDPEIMAGDRVVVGLNALNDAWMLYFQRGGVLNIFRPRW